MKKKLKKRKCLYYRKVFKTYSIWEVIQIIAFIMIVVGIIDWNDIPSKTILFEKFNLGIAFIFCIIILASIKRLNIQDFWEIKAVNAIDLWLFVGNFFSIGYYFFCVVYGILEYYKIIILCSIYLFTGMCLLIRKSDYEQANKYADKSNENTIDLKKLYDGECVNLDGVCFLDEREVDYDLLDRKSIINHLYNVICKCKPQKRFVISLEGKWGAGKSTILKNVKRMIREKQDNIVIIDDFDPWTYGTEESIVENFFCCLLNHNELRINTIEMRKNVTVLLKAVINSNEKSDWVESIFLNRKKVEESKKQINEYLKLCDKRVVFFIDNLDRVSDEKILLLFKLIGNVLDFERIIFVVSFDPAVVKTILEKKSQIGYDYLEKIIQMQIGVPEISRTVLSEVMQVSVTNLLKAYRLNDEERREYREFIENVCESIKDIRDFKRITNSVIVKVLNSKSYLSKKDLLTIEYIKIKNFELYQTIYKNRRFFISESIIYDRELYYSCFSRDKYEKDLEEFFAELFSKESNRQYQVMLGKIFPNIGNLNQKINYRSVDERTSKQIEKTRGIASAKYFSLYFSDTENEYSMLGGEVEKYVSEINCNKVEVRDGYVKLLNYMGTIAHKEMLELLQLYIPEIDEEKIYDLCISLIDYFWDVDDSCMFLATDARRRCAILIYEIIQILNTEEFETLLQYLANAFDKIEIISEIAYWFDKEKQNETKYILLKKLEKKLVNEVIADKINLYDDQYYHRTNIWPMYRNLKDEGDTFRQYIEGVCNRVTIFRILYDAMGHSYGSGHRYYFQKSQLNEYFCEDKLREVMKKISPVTEDETFIMEVYEDYLINSNNMVEDEGGVYCSEEKKLFL